MISFIHCGSEIKWQHDKLADDRSEVAAYGCIKLASAWVYEDDAENCLGYSVLYQDGFTRN